MPGNAAKPKPSTVPPRASAVPPRIGFGRFHVKLPHSKFWRIALGVALLIGSLFWFLPILGLWMLPLGIMVLAVDIPAAKRLSKWTVARWRETQGWREKWWGWWRKDKKRRPDLRDS